MKLLLLVVLMSSCTVIDKKNITTSPEKKIKYDVKTVNLSRGKIVFHKQKVHFEDGNYKLICKSQNEKKNNKFDVKVFNKTATVYLNESYFAKPQLKKCFIEEYHLININVLDFDYPKEKLNVAKGKVHLSPKNMKRVEREFFLKKELYKKSASTYLFDRPFIKPLNSYITSYYGNQRIFNNSKKSQHLGTDFRAPVGLKIPASNRGRVIFTGNLFYTGNVVVIDHGMNIFTVYAHLSKILVSKNSIVQQGDIIGLAGATGRVSGPHLHWGVKLNNHWVDGFDLVRESQKHFKR